MRKPKLPKVNLSALIVLGLVIYGMAFDNSTDFDVGAKLAVVPVAAGLAAAAPAIIKGVASLGSTLLGGIFGRKKQKDANQAQIQLANEMFEKESQQQWDMWNAQNEYNTPVNQVQRLQEAGINPALAMQSINTGSASAMTSPKHNMPNIQPEDAMANAMGQIPSILGQSFGQYMEYESMLKNFETQDAQNKLIKAQAAGVDIENQYKERQILAGLEQVWSDTKESKWRRKLAKQQYEWMESTRDLRYTMLENENNVTSENVNWLRQQIDSAQIRDRIAQLSFWNNKRLTDAQINNLAASTSKFYTEAKAIYSDMRIKSDSYWLYDKAEREERLQILQKSAQDMIDKAHNDKLLSDEAYEQAKARTSMISTEHWWYQTMHGQNTDSGFESFISKIVGGLTMASDVLGNVFGSGITKIASK